MAQFYHLLPGRDVGQGAAGLKTGKDEGNTALFCAGVSCIMLARALLNGGAETYRTAKPGANFIDKSDLSVCFNYIFNKWLIFCNIGFMYLWIQCDK